jgi:hypothetical protein
LEHVLLLSYLFHLSLCCFKFCLECFFGASLVAAEIWFGCFVKYREVEEFGLQFGRLEYGAGLDGFYFG